MQSGWTGGISCSLGHNIKTGMEQEGQKTPNTVSVTHGAQLTCSKVRIAENSHPHCFSFSHVPANFGLFLPRQTPVALFCPRTLFHRTTPMDRVLWGELLGTLLLLDHVLNFSYVLYTLSLPVGLAIVTPVRGEAAKQMINPRKEKQFG